MWTEVCVQAWMCFEYQAPLANWRIVGVSCMTKANMLVPCWNAIGLFNFCVLSSRLHTGTHDIIYQVSMFILHAIHSNWLCLSAPPWTAGYPSILFILWSISSLYSQLRSSSWAPDQNSWLPNWHIHVETQIHTKRYRSRRTMLRILLAVYAFHGTRLG